jgi:hypothetical protein
LASSSLRCFHTGLIDGFPRSEEIRNKCAVRGQLALLLAVGDDFGQFIAEMPDNATGADFVRWADNLRVTHGKEERTKSAPVALSGISAMNWPKSFTKSSSLFNLKL